MTTINTTFLDSLQTPTDAVLETIANLKDIDLQQKIIQLFQNKNREGEVAHPPLFFHRISLIKKSLDHQAAWLVNPILESFSHEELRSLWKDLIKAIMEGIKGSDAKGKLYQRVWYVVRIDFLFTQSVPTSPNHQQARTQLIQFFIETYPDLISILIDQLCANADLIHSQAQSSLGIEILSQLIPSLPTDYFLPLYNCLHEAYFKCDHLRLAPNRVLLFLKNLLEKAPLSKKYNQMLVSLNLEFQNPQLSNLSTEEGSDLQSLSPWAKLALFRLAHGLDQQNSPINLFAEESNSVLSGFFSTTLCTNIYSQIIAEDKEYPSEVLSQALAIASNSCISYEALAKRIQEGKLTIIPAGYLAHIITLCFGSKGDRDYLFICNNGEGRNHANISAFPIDRSKVQPQHIIRLGELFNKTHIHVVLDYYFKELPKQLEISDLPTDDFCEFVEFFPWKALKSGTCIHGSVKTSINAALACLLDTQDFARIKWIRRIWSQRFRELAATLGQQALDALKEDLSPSQLLLLQSMLLEGKKKREHLILTKTEQPGQLFSPYPEIYEGTALSKIVVGGLVMMDQVSAVIDGQVYPMYKTDLYWKIPLLAQEKPISFSIQAYSSFTGLLKSSCDYQVPPSQKIHLFFKFPTLQQPL